MDKETKSVWAERITKLLAVKSIVTLVMTAILAVMLLTELEPARELLALFSTTYGAVITYFFTRKDGKNV